MSYVPQAHLYIEKDEFERLQNAYNDLLKKHKGLQERFDKIRLALGKAQEFRKDHDAGC
jgi:hypothetical protein